MKIDELIKELKKFKKEHGNLEVGIARLTSPYKDIDYYSDIVIFRVEKGELITYYDEGLIDTFCALG